MDIRLAFGDITDAENGYIVHGVNLQNKMGSGVAKSLYEQWRLVKDEYHGAWFMGSAPKLGQVQYVHVDPGLVVVNAFTQEFYGYDGQRYACPEAIATCLKTVCDMMVATNVPAEQRRIHMPKIGGERGGLDFDKEVMPNVEILAGAYPSITFIVWTYVDYS